MSADADASASHPITVELAIPASPEYLRLARLAASDLGSRAGFVVEEIDDLRIAVDELCYAVIGPDRRAGGTRSIVLRYTVLDRAVVIEGRGEPGTMVGRPSELSAAIVAAVADEHEFDTRHGATTFRMVKRGRGP